MGGGGLSEIWKFCRKFRRLCPPPPTGKSEFPPLSILTILSTSLSRDAFVISRNDIIEELAYCHIHDSTGQFVINKMSQRCCTADLLPVCFSGILLMTVSISFVIAVAQSDITPWFPAISDTATKSPESNVFSQFVNIATFIGFALVYVRYLQVKRDVSYLMGSRAILKLNRHTLLFGLLSILGASIVANFPVRFLINVLNCYLICKVF